MNKNLRFLTKRYLCVHAMIISRRLETGQSRKILFVTSLVKLNDQHFHNLPHLMGIGSDHNHLLSCEGCPQRNRYFLFVIKIGLFHFHIIELQLQNKENEKRITRRYIDVCFLLFSVRLFT